jgi:hypothetical protein
LTQIIGKIRGSLKQLDLSGVYESFGKKRVTFTEFQGFFGLDEMPIRRNDENENKW